MTRSGFLILHFAGVVATITLLTPLKVVGQTPAEGVKVHGHWVIEVRSAEGTLQHRREFDNALTATGKTALARYLSRGSQMGRWRITLVGTGCTSKQPSGGPLPIGITCSIDEPGSAEDVTSTNLTVSTTTNAEVILKGSVVPDVGPITAVQTLHQPFNPPTTFTASTLASSIPLQKGQTVSVTVTIGFQ